MNPERSWNRRDLFRGAGLAAAAVQTAASAPTPTYNRGQKVRIGVVGGRFGSTFQWHLHPDSSVTAVCDVRPDRLKHLK